MALSEAYAAETDATLNALAQQPFEPDPPAEKRSAWNIVPDIPKALVAGAAEFAGNAEDALRTFGKVTGLQNTDRNLSEMAPAFGNGGTTDAEELERIGKMSGYRTARELAPDPMTAGKAEQVVYGLTKGVAKGVAAIATLGPYAGAAAFGGSEGLTALDELQQEGVDDKTARKVAAATAAGSGLAMLLPVVGKTIPRSIGLMFPAAAAYMGQMEASKRILEGADYEELAQRYDPLDPLGIALSVLPGGVIAAGIHGMRYRASLKAEPNIGKGEPSAEPTQNQDTGKTEPKLTPDQVDAVMVHNLTLANDMRELTPPEERVLKPEPEPMDVQQTVANQLKALGVGEQEAMDKGLLWDSFFNSMAEKTGRTPRDLMDEYFGGINKGDETDLSPQERLDAALTRYMAARGEESLFQARVAADERSLIIQHNLTEQNLLHAVKMGGIPVPSLAVTSKDHPLLNFGEITLLGSKEMADPRGYASTKVFGGDIYSPRYPEISYKLNNAALEKLNAKLAPYYKNGGRKLYGDDIRKVDDLTQNDAFRNYMLQKTGKKDVRDLSHRDMEGEARAWLSEAGAEEKIFRGFTNMGNRKYIPHTLENVVKILKKELRGGEGFNYGVGSIRAKHTPQFRSIEAIRKAKGRLMDKGSFEKVKEEIDKQFSEVANELESYHPASDRFGFGDTVSMMMGDAAKMGIPRALRENGFEDVPIEVQKSIAEFLDKLKNVPTEYFEAKILRDVDLAEFSGAVVPDDVDPKVIEALKDRGVKDIRTYKRGDEQDRAAKIGGFDNLLFQSKANQFSQQGEMVGSDNIKGMADDESAAANKPNSAAAGNPGTGSLTPDQLSKIFDESRWLDRGLKIGAKTKLYRGEDANTGNRVPNEGRGLYITTDKSQAQGYGAVREMSHDDLPKNPIRFRDTATFNEWRRFVARELGFKRDSEFEQQHGGFADAWIRKFDPSIDGIQIGTGHGAFFVKFPHELQSPAKTGRDKVMAGQPLFQGEHRGYLEFGPQSKMSIALLSEADKSTFLHESGHFFLEVMNDLAKTTPELQGMMGDVFKWMGVTPEQWAKMSLNEKRPYHEQWARGFESYLRDGKAPNSRLKEAFARFRDWLLELYHNAASLNVTLSDEVRSVMDRMLTSQKEHPSEAPREPAAGPPPPSGEAPAVVSELDHVLATGEPNLGNSRPIDHPQIRAEIQHMGMNEVGWDQVGGRLIRTTNEYGDEEVSRTQWIPRAEWWPDRPTKYANSGPKLTDGEVMEAVEKWMEGKELTDHEQKTIDYMHKIANDRLDAIEQMGADEFGKTMDDVHAAGLEPTTENVFDSQAVARAMELNPEAFAKAAEAYDVHDDEALFMGEIRSIINEHIKTSSQADAGGQADTGAEGQSLASTEPGGNATDGSASSPRAQAARLEAQQLELAQRLVDTRPDMPVAVTEDGTQVTLKQMVDDAVRLADEGTDTEFGALDVDLIQAAADCFLSSGGV